MRKLILILLLMPCMAINAQNTGNCKLTLYLVGEGGASLAGHSFSLYYQGAAKLGDFQTDAQGKSTIELKKNTVYRFETKINGRTMQTEFPIENEDQVQFELQLAASGEAASDSVKVIFHVTDEKGIVESEAKIAVTESGRTVFSCTTDVDGYCQVMLLKNKDYKLIVNKFGKEFNLDLDLPPDPDLAEYTFHLKIKVVERYIRSFVLDNVYFDYNKWDLKPESNAALNSLYDMLKADPAMKIEIGGHTDSDGPDAFNMQLSQRRADAVKNYLVTKGISAGRLLTKGYGETTPIASNTTDEGKAKNRRTEIKVIE